MADTRLSDLSAAGALSASDLFYVVQTPGSGGEKATGTQLLTLVGTTYLAKAGGTMTGALTLPAGAVGTPSLLFTGSGATTGIYSAGATDVSIAVGGARIAYAYSDSFWAAGASGFGILSDAAALYFGGSANCILRRDTAGVLAQRNGTNAQTLRVYSTYTDSSNYERLSLSTTAGTSVNITAETLGTGGDNLNIVLTPAGTGVVSVPALVSATSFTCGNDVTMNFSSAGIRARSTGEYAWTAGNATAAADTAIHRDSAGVAAVDNGTAGTYRDLKLRNLINNPSTFAGLTAAATAGAGARAFINDGAANVYGVAAAGGGALKIPVYSDGANWIVG